MPAPPLTVRFLVHTSDTERRPVDPADIYWVEADGGDTWLRFGARRRLRDIRPLGTLQRALSAHRFVRIHHSHLVNPRRIALLRKRSERDWELKLAPPANRILPISREGFRALQKVFGDA